MLLLPYLSLSFFCKMGMIAEPISGFLSESNGKHARAVVSVIMRSVPGVGAGVVHVQADSETGGDGRSTPSCRQRADPLQICKNSSGPLWLWVSGWVDRDHIIEGATRDQKGLESCLHLVAEAVRIILSSRMCPGQGPGWASMLRGCDGVPGVGEGTALFSALTFSSLPRHLLGPRRHQRGLPLPGEWDSMPPQLSELPLS